MAWLLAPQQPAATARPRVPRPATAGTATGTAGTPTTGGGGGTPATTGGTATGGASAPRPAAPQPAAWQRRRRQRHRRHDPVVACKAGATALNGSGLTVSATDISAFKLADKSSGVKMAYDRSARSSLRSRRTARCPASIRTSRCHDGGNRAVGTIKTYDSGGYAAENGFGDHRGIVFDSKGTLYILAVRGGGNVGVSIKKGVLNAAGPARTWTVLVSTSQGFAAGGTNFDHSFSGLAVSADDASLYFSSGSRTDHGEMEAGAGEVPLSSAVFKVPTATATDMKNDATALAGVLFADGTRNASIWISTPPAT